jgi:hypothetical protein
LHRVSPEPAVLVFADGDDVGVSRVVANLAKRLGVTWWRFGLPETSISVDVDRGSFCLKQPGATVRSDDLWHTPIVVYRRRLLQPRPLVHSELSSPADRDFSEREWTSLIDGLLLGLPVPAFSVSTPVRFPSSASQDLVTKAISADERIDETRYFSTARLSAKDLRDLPGTRIPTPSLLQEYISPSLELRVFYVLGEFLTLALTPSAKHVDIRHTPRADLFPRPHDLAPELRSALGELAREFNLGYCTFDFIVPRDGPTALVDITPNGDWDYFESDATPLVSEFLADTISSRFSHKQGRRR